MLPIDINQSMNLIHLITQKPNPQLKLHFQIFKSTHLRIFKLPHLQIFKLPHLQIFKLPHLQIATTIIKKP